jgi:hypothetical protein
MAFDYSKELLTPEIKQWYQEYYTNGNLQSTILKEVSFNSLRTLGVNIPNYWELKSKGSLIPHTVFHQDEAEHIIVPSNYFQRIGGNTAEHKNYAAAVSTFSQLLPGVAHVPDTAYAQAMVQQAAANIANAGWDGLTFASEIPSLRRMFVKTARRMKRLHTRFYGGDVQKAMLKRRRSKGNDFSFNDLWLEGRYGWRTLAYDLRDLDDAVRSYDAKRKIWTERSGYSISQSSSSSSSLKWSAGYIDCESTTVTESSIRGAIAAEFRPSRVTLDPINTAWELIPYSFVVDWFLGVGNALATSKLLMLAKAHTASIGVKSVSTRTSNVTCRPDPGDEMTYNDSYVGICTEVQRTPTAIQIRPAFTGRILDGNLLLDLRALVSGGKKPLRR